MRMDAVLARGVTDAGEPRDATTAFPEDAERIYVVLTSAMPATASVRAAWVAVDVDGHDRGAALGDARVSVAAGGRGSVWLEAPGGGFTPGDYRVDLKIDGAPGPSLPFAIVPLLPPAARLDPQSAPRGYNIALAALGGRVERATSQYDETSWAARNLIDGVAFVREGRGCRSTCGWSARDDTVPQEIVFSFHQGREATIHAVIVDTTTWETLGRPDRMPKHVEVWTSTAGPTDGFARVAGARLHRRPGEHVITVPATRARFVKLRILSHYGGAYAQMGEVAIIEAPAGASILADAPKNLALPELGGAVVRFTSTYSHAPIGGLIDGRDGDGWRSEDGPYGTLGYLPQELVFAFRGDRTALIDRIVLGPNRRHDAATWPRVISVSVSEEGPLDGFREVGQVTLTRTPGDQAFPLNTRARFVKLRILRNFGGRYTSLGKVRILEGTAPGYESILLASDDPASPGAGVDAPVDETGIAVETEPNDTAAQASRLELGRRTKGTIDPLGELDHFALAIPGSGASVLTLELLGRPNLRTSLALLDATGRPVRRFDPGRVPGRRALFSWAVDPGTHVVQVTEPPISLVLIWDTSGSMDRASVENLRQAVEGYLDQVRGTERLNLIRFSADRPGNEVEVLLPEFTSDRERLKAAVAGKFYANGGTPLYDAVARGIELLDGVRGNRAVVVMTDGADTSSRLPHAGFWKTIEEKRIRVYTIGLGTELATYVPAIGTAGSRVLAHVAAATNGRYFFARTAEELRGLYQRIADELRTPSTYYLRATVSRGSGRLAVSATGERLAAVSAPSQIELILDGSGSMRARVDGRPKMDIAKDVMSQIIRGLPDDAQVALRFYGHRIQEGRPGDCRDTELVVPFGRIDKARMLARVRDVRALGTTPIAYTLRQVAGDFGRAPGEKLVILVTDGKEECGGDPAAAVAELQAKGLRLRLNIVGFALADAATKRDMARIARMTGGSFFDAASARALTQAIEQSLAVPYDVLDAAGTRIGGGLTGQAAVSVPEGVYTVVVRAAGRPITVPNVRAAPGGFTKVVLTKEGDEIGIQVHGP
jgi:Mg-chelatase subunit ChlD